MEMDDAAIQHIMNVQTQMLQQIMQLQQDRNRDDLQRQVRNVPSVSSSSEPLQGDANVMGTPLPESIASPVTPPSIDTRPASGTLAPSDPTQYMTYAGTPLYTGNQGDRQNRHKGPSLFEERGLIGGTLAEMRDFDPTRHSKESTAQYFSSQTRGIQQQVADVGSGVLQGAVGAGSFFIPGIVPSIVLGGAAAVGVGGAASAISTGAKEALDYQELLQNESYKFMNAFESTAELGGIGMGLEDRQEISSFLRDLAPEKFLDSDEMSQILEGASQNNLLKAVSDVKSFKERFSEVVDAVKEISITMNQTVEEATAFMGEMERRGIGLNQMSNISASSKVMSSMLGIDASEGADMLLQTSDQLTQGTAIAPTLVMQSTSQSVTAAQQLMDRAAQEDPELYQLMKNSGSAGGVGVSFQETTRNFLRSEQGSSDLLGFFATGFEKNESGDWEINEERMREVLSGGASMSELQSQSQQFLNDMPEEDKYRLLGTAGAAFSASADEYDLAEFAKRTAELYQETAARSGQEMSFDTALMQSGLAGDYEQAKLLENMIDVQLDEEDRAFRTSKVIKEEADSHAISTSPGLFKRMKFAFERNVTNPIGDVGQFAADAVGTELNEYQKWVTGIDDRSIVGGELLPEFSREGAQEALERINATNESSEGMEAFLNEQASQDLKSGDVIGAAKKWVQGKDIAAGEIDVERAGQVYDAALDNTTDFTTGQMNIYLSRLNRGTLTATEMAELSESKDDGNWWNINDVSASARKSIVERKAEGDYEGILGGLTYVGDRATSAVYSGAASAWNFVSGEDESAGLAPSFNFAGQDMTKRSLEKQQEAIVDSKKDFTNELNKLFTSGDLGEMSEDEYRELETAIRSGAVSDVKGITKNADAIQIAENFKSLSEQESNYSEGVTGYTDYSRYTKGIATAGTFLGDLFNESGVFTEGEIDDLLGDINKRGKKTNKKIKKGKYSVEDMAKVNAETEADIEAIFKYFPEQDMTQIANDLLEMDTQLVATDLFTDDSKTAVDPEKLQEVLMKQIQLSNASTTNKEKDSEDDDEGKSSKEAKEAAKEHTQAMQSFLTSYQQETQMLRDAVNGQDVSSGNYSSVGNR